MSLVRLSSLRFRKIVKLLKFLCDKMEVSVYSRFKENIWIFGVLFFLLLPDGYFANTEIYTDPCNETIFLSNPNKAGKLIYSHSPTVGENNCNILIKAEPDFHIGYSFKETTAFREIFIQDDNIFYTCTSVFWGGAERFGCDKSSYTDEVHTTRSNILTLQVRGDNISYFKFELDLFIFHFSQCNSYEMQCYAISSFYDSSKYACINRGLACNENYNFCDSLASECSDVVVDYVNLNTSLIAAIVLLCAILVPLLSFSVFMIVRKFCKKREPEEDVPTRARRIFAEIVAEAHENAGYDTGPIDPSKFDPPPDYGSLEILDGANSSASPDGTRLSQISIESPPCYNDVMSNSTEYLVSNHI